MLVKLQGVLVYQNEIGRKEHGPPSYGAAEPLVRGQFFTVNMNCTKLLMAFCVVWFLVWCFFFSPIFSEELRNRNQESRHWLWRRSKRQGIRYHFLSSAVKVISVTVMVGLATGCLVVTQKRLRWRIVLTYEQLSYKEKMWLYLLLSNDH